MEGNQDKLGLLAIFAPDADIGSLRLRLGEAGIRTEQIEVLTPIPLAARGDAAIHPFWPYGITIAAGLVGIAVGVFFAAGTAALYPLPTGGKPIIAAPVVGIISYETMMLLAVVVTFLTAIVRIRRAQRMTVDRETRIDEGTMALSLRVIHQGQEADIRRVLETAGAQDIRLVSTHHPLPDKQQPAQALTALTLFFVAAAGCSPDMQEQPSYRSQESPRRHSPPESIPRQSLAVISHEALAESSMPDRAKELYRVNCLPCHGDSGEGTGPVAPYLNELPANLLAPKVRALSSAEIYNVITNGKDMMPSFRGELSATERMVIASFVQSMRPDAPLLTPK